MVKLLIDTCVWLDIAKDHQQQNFVSALDQLIEDKLVELIVPGIVIQEFHRNKSKIVEDSKRSLHGVIKRVKEIVNKFGDIAEKQKVMDHLSDVQFKSPVIGEYAAIGSINWITTLLQQAKVDKTTSSIKLRAADRAMNRLAPFHRNKNNMSDAIIIETYIAYLSKSHPKNTRFIFVTHNTEDFSHPSGDKNNPHPDFSDIFNQRKSRYYIRLSDALNNISPKIVPQLLIEREEFSRNPKSLSEILAAEDELVTKIWYNRHQILLEKIQDGKIKIVSDAEWEIAKSHTTIKESIFKGARRSARKVERKYGIKNLLWNDFEWGMLNGKLSALRWVLGEDWDELYT